MNQHVVIETGIPISEPVRYKPERWPLRAMQIGDSFVVDTLFRPIEDVRSAVYRAAARAGVKVVTRKIDDRHVRVWKVGREVRSADGSGSWVIAGFIKN